MRELNRQQNVKQSANVMFAPIADAMLRVAPGRGVDLDERLKDLMQELGNAINESLSDSDRIAGAIGEIKREGYDVFLVLEATIGFNKRSEDDTDEEMAETAAVRFEAPDKIEWTSQDTKFLRALKISVEDEG